MKDSIIWIDSCDSTNTRLAGMADELSDGTVVAAREQTAGRGQRGNSWESEPHKNLTCSMLMLHQEGEMPASRQFSLSEAVALGIVDALREYLPRECEVRVKWPNDIYVGDRKICGILIEHSISGGCLSRSIAGIGVNINQQHFRSDAPNPVSVINLTGQETDVDDFLIVMRDKIEARRREESEANHRDYKASLWRKSKNSYRETASGERFEAAIEDVLPDGTLCLVDTTGGRRNYLFKEVAVVLAK